MQLGEDELVVEDLEEVRTGLSDCFSATHCCTSTLVSFRNANKCSDANDDQSFDTNDDDRINLQLAPGKSCTCSI